MGQFVTFAASVGSVPTLGMVPGRVTGRNANAGTSAPAGIDFYPWSAAPAVLSVKQVECV